ncbi:hypothetical protein Vretimale_4164 [Volvox reticuliferus]|uniref:Uncharacterized protein n=1 Tax=Volvox reticuliferus TaxID=1737510 RepID=A0A8J4G128_9CHLO|nr:hypothetical protein Vretifemale_2749 [Volvox reticuliferus]GIL98861.1 hypothetical protein Vretimale_4164 [Volvox reticuliferus]
MEPHSLVLLSGSALDACHHTHLHGTQTRRVLKPVPPQRPLRNLAQGLARLFPQLRQLGRRLRRTSTDTSENGQATIARTWRTTSDNEASTSSKCCSTMPNSQHSMKHKIQSRWRAPRWRREAPHAMLQLGQELVDSLPVVTAKEGDGVPQRQHRLSVLREDQVREHEQVQLRTDKMHLDQTSEYQEQEQEGDQQVHAQCLQRHRVLTAQRLTSVPHRRGLLRCLGRFLRAAGIRMRPQGPGENDKNMPERILNVATCGMFFQAGGNIVRLCRSLSARRFGWAFLAVGAIATIYHSSWGRIRPLARKVDYYSIALSSLLLRSAVVGPLPRWLTATMLAAIPFKPTLISTTNFMAVEVRYMLLAFSQRHLLAQWAAHTSMSMVATACFTLEDTVLSWFPYTHAAFHTLSAAAFLTLPSALNQLTGPLALSQQPAVAV